MSKHDKPIAMIVARPPEASYNDVEQLLLSFGWTEKHKNGTSHHIFFKRSEDILSIPIHGGKTVKRKYLDDICTTLKLDDLVK